MLNSKVDLLQADIHREWDDIREELESINSALFVKLNTPRIYDFRLLIYD